MGFVPLTDCAPLVVARETGAFARHGLRVDLHRELGWATIRDKIIHGELDAAHAVAGLPFATSLGLGCVRCECVTGLVLSLQGNAITLSRTLRDRGVRDAGTLREMIRREGKHHTPTFGVAFLHSSHNFLLRQWLRAAGIHPDRDVRIAVVPPPQMFKNLQAGNLDGYCVGEPWNSQAIQAGVGFAAATSADLAPRHPEKVLLVRADFARQRAPEHEALIAALLEAGAWCDDPANAPGLIRLLAQRDYLHTSVSALTPSLSGGFVRDEAGGSVPATAAPFHLFHGGGTNEPSADKAAWILRQMVAAGTITDRAVLTTPAVREAFRPDIFHRAQQLTVPAAPPAATTLSA